MVAPLPDVPGIGWFELEILYYLMETKRYGNEMRLMLNEHLGPETVTTGKLYPVLKKLEKDGLIKRLKIKKSDIDQMETGMRNILTRGVERKYFEITEQGVAELDRALHFTSNMHFNVKMSLLHREIKESMGALLRPLGEDITVGVICAPTKTGVQRTVEMLPSLDGGALVFLVLGSQKDLDIDPGTEFEAEVSSFPSRYDDIPLKGNYLDAVISTVHFVDIPNPEKFIREMARTVKPGGQVIFVDIARLDSLILDDILSHHIDAVKSSGYRGESMDELSSLLEPHVVKVHAERVKELLFIHGKKLRKRARG
ncbi:MAG: helix-turn-helix transcriptional regulator [Candidatus Thermoplasmatota archaeon]|nr:helix-turn-helix transcriptional regulator [Candidatus Thermoplasmatota archaeon]